MLFTMELFKLNVVKGKALLFVNSIEQAFKIRLVLESFGHFRLWWISEQQMSSLHHVLQVKQIVKVKEVQFKL